MQVINVGKEWSPTLSKAPVGAIKLSQCYGIHMWAYECAEGSDGEARVRL